MEENPESEMEKTTRIYEVGFLLIPTLADEKLLQTFAAIKEILNNASATMISESFPKPRPLAYPIEKFESAFFGWLKFESAKETLETLQNFLKNNKEIIRFLIVKTFRESAISTPIFFGKTREWSEKKKDRKDEIATPKMTNEELDKTIEELVVE